MKIDGYNVEITDITTDLSDSNVIFCDISKDAVKKYFDLAKITPRRDHEGQRDDSYISGDLQYIFDKENNLEEILLYPVYTDEEEESFINGEDFISISDEAFWSEPVINEFKDRLSSYDDLTR